MSFRTEQKPTSQAFSGEKSCQNNLMPDSETCQLSVSGLLTFTSHSVWFQIEMPVLQGAGWE